MLREKHNKLTDSLAKIYGIFDTDAIVDTAHN